MPIPPPRPKHHPVEFNKPSCIDDIHGPEVPKLIWSCIQCRDSIELKDDFSLDFIKANLDMLDKFVTEHSQHRLHFTIPKGKQAEDYKENIEIMMGVFRERDRRKADGS